MTQNTSPIYTTTPLNNWGKVTAADATMDGTNGNVVLVHTASATNGGFIQKLICQPISTSGSTTASAANLRIYVNNGSSVGTGTNNILIGEYQLSATAVNVTAVAPAYNRHIVLNFQLAVGYKIYCGVTAMAANTQWNIFAIAGDY